MPLPSDIGSLVAWYDAAEGITLNGSDVSDWADQSGQSNDLAQGTAADQPFYNTSNSAFNNHPTVDFDGVDHFLSGAFTSATTQPWTLVVVCDHGGGGDTTERRIFASLAGFSPRLTYRLTAAFSGFACGSSLGDSTPANDFGATIFTGIGNSTSSDIFHNDVSQGAGDAGTDVISTTGIILGAWHSPLGDRAFNGAYSEVMIYDKGLSDAERNSLGYWLASKYSISTGFSAPVGMLMQKQDVLIRR